MNLFPQYILKSDGKEYYGGPKVNYLDLFNQNIDLFNFKEYDKYENILFNDKDKSEAAIEFLETLEDDEDVQNVYSNINFSNN